MYFESLTINHIKTFDEPELVEFVHPDRRFNESQGNGTWPKPKLQNVTLILGDNGSGKSTLLQALALSAFGPAVMEAKLPARNLVRISDKLAPADRVGSICAKMFLHEQDSIAPKVVDSLITITRKGELERIEAEGDFDQSIWRPVYSSDNTAFFIVGYGATRRTETSQYIDRPKASFIRTQRVEGLFRDSYSLIPLASWLPQLRKSNLAHYSEVIELINELMGKGHLSFAGEYDKRTSDYLFERGGVQIPFQSLSDGYRSFLGWVVDLLYHLQFGCPEEQSLRNVRGVVLVDEVDLHLHPKWQMTVVATLAKTLPRLQFVFTSHSPLVAGSLERTNIVCLKLGSRNRSSTSRIDISVHGLDADQILLTELFGLKSTRAAPKNRRLNELTQRARGGDNEAAKQLIAELATGLEKDE